MTRRCNLHCIHCYAEAKDDDTGAELSTSEAKAMIDDLAQFGTPVLLFSGGEPFLRADLMELIDYAGNYGIRTVVSTNGTLIDRHVAQDLKAVRIAYVGISLDGTEETNDRFRGVKGAFSAAMRGISACQEEGIKVGLRFTVNRRNVAELPAIFDLVSSRHIERICVYHLVYAGRGSHLVHEDLSHEETRRVLHLIMDRTAELFPGGSPRKY